MSGFGYGSVSIKHNVTLDIRVCIVVYSTLSHHLNSLLHISYDVPATMSGILRKQGPIERFLSDIENVDEESLYMGTVWSTNTMEKPPLAVILSNSPLTTAALPSNVTCWFLCL